MVLCKECGKSVKSAEGLEHHRTSKHPRGVSIRIPSWSTLKKPLLIVLILIGIGMGISIIRTGGVHEDVGTVPLTATDHVLGDPNAPATIEMFEDFECPTCSRFHETTYRQLLHDVEAGRVKLVFKQFPLRSYHPHAMKAAESSECVAALGGNEAFWNFHDLLFENAYSGERWERHTVRDAIEVWVTYAESVGVSRESFRSCVNSGEMKNVVLEQFNEGRSRGIGGTPSFIVNGQKVVGAQPYFVFKNLLSS